MLELNAKGVKAPVLLGGAALTRDYAEEDLANLYGGPLLYCKDAFEGLHVMDAIASRQTERVVTAQKERAEKRKRLRETAVKPRSTDAANADSSDAAAASHMPSGRKTCEGMWRAWLDAGAIVA